MSATAILAVLAAAVAAALGLMLLRNRARLAELESLQRVGPNTLTHAGEPAPTARAIRDGWAQVFQQMIYSASDVFWETDAEHRYKRILYRDHGARKFDFDDLLGHAPWEYPAAYPVSSRSNIAYLRPSRLISVSLLLFS